MQHVKLAGLCLVSMLAIGMALAGNASAIPTWLVCTSGEGATEYSTGQCTTASKGGEFVSVDARASAVVSLTFTLTLKDTGTALGTAEVQCWGGRSTEIIGSGNEAEILAAKVEKPETLCKGLKVCESAKVKAVEGVNLPWKTELQEGTEKMAKTTIEGTGGGAGWKLTCNAPIVGEETDTCTDKSGEPEEISFLNTVSSGVSLVLGRFLEARKASCTLGSSTSGSFSGLLALLQEDENGLSITTNGAIVETPRWFIEGKELSGNETFTAKAVAGKVIKLKNKNIEVECTAATMGAGNIKNPTGAFRLENIKFEKCTVLKPAAVGEEKCVVETGEIPLKQQLAVAQWKSKTGEEAAFDFFDYSKAEIMKFTINPEAGKNCTAKGTYIATGEVIAAIENASKEEATKKFSLTCPGITGFWIGSEPNRLMNTPETPLKIGLVGALEKGEFCGTFEFTLTSGKTFRTKSVG